MRLNHLFLTAILAGCYAYRPAGPAPAPESRVRVVLTSVTTVTTIASGRDSSRHSYAGVMEASGITESVAGDTLALRLGELRTATGPVPDVAGQVALLPADRIARIEQRRFQAGTTALAGVGLAALALATFVVVVIATLTKGF